MLVVPPSSIAELTGLCPGAWQGPVRCRPCGRPHILPQGVCPCLRERMLSLCIATPSRRCCVVTWSTGTSKSMPLHFLGFLSSLLSRTGSPWRRQLGAVGARDRMYHLHHSTSSPTVRIPSPAVQSIQGPGYTVADVHKAHKPSARHDLIVAAAPDTFKVQTGTPGPRVSIHTYFLFVTMYRMLLLGIQSTRDGVWSLQLPNDELRVLPLLPSPSQWPCAAAAARSFPVAMWWLPCWADANNVTPHCADAVVVTAAARSFPASWIPSTATRAGPTRTRASAACPTSRYWVGIRGTLVCTPPRILGGYQGSSAGNARP